MDSLPITHPARAAYGQSRMTTDKFRAGVFGGLLSILELWADINIAYLTAAQDHDLESPGTRPTAIYLVIPDERTTYNTLAVLYIAQLYQALIDLGNRSPGRRLERRVNFILDEFGNLPAIPDFCTKLTTCRSRNIRFLLAVQGLDQIEHRYPAHRAVDQGCRGTAAKDRCREPAGVLHDGCSFAAGPSPYPTPRSSTRTGLQGLSPPAA